MSVAGSGFLPSNTHLEPHGSHQIKPHAQAGQQARWKSRHSGHIACSFLLRKQASPTLPAPSLTFPRLQRARLFPLPMAFVPPPSFSQDSEPARCQGRLHLLPAATWGYKGWLNDLREVMGLVSCLKMRSLGSDKNTHVKMCDIMEV